MRDGCGLWRRPLAANDLGPIAPDVIEDDRHVAAGSIEMWLDHLQRECSRNSCIEGVATFFQRRHADRRRDPMGGGDNAERSFDLGPCCEGIGINLGNANFFHAPAM